MLALILWGCTATNECLTHADCGESQACQGDVARGEAVCVTVECLTSNVCVHGEFCSPDTYTCEEGCQATADCPLQYECLAGECELAASCTDTQRDCAVGEYCIDGVCERDFDICDTCSWGCSSGFECDGRYCVPTCSSQSDCPAGFTCWQEYSMCVNDCGWLREHGYM